VNASSNDTDLTVADFQSALDELLELKGSRSFRLLQSARNNPIARRAWRLVFGEKRN